MFEIIYLLLEKKQVTAKQLAEHFEVSVRTIYRDIDRLTISGVPIYTDRGKGGGIRLPENYTLNKSMLNEQEQQEILSSLQGIYAVTMEQHNQTLKKLSAFFQKDMTDWIAVDFSDWSGTGTEQFYLLKDAVLNRMIVIFTYFNSVGESARRSVEPLQLWFKHGAWYLKAICLDKGQQRIFKLTRMKELLVTDQSFAVRRITEEDITKTQLPESKRYQTFQFMIASEMSYRVYDEFEMENIRKLETGNFIVSLNCPEDEWLYGYILSYGEYLKVISPSHIKNVISEKIMKMTKLYL